MTMKWTCVLFISLTSHMAKICVSQSTLTAPWPCAPSGQWLDTRTNGCNTCSKEPCHIGYYREICASKHLKDAQCVPCSQPPANSVHTSGGLPYTFNGCLWACKDGYFKDIGRKVCIACTKEGCVQEGFVREECRSSKHPTKDAQCICPFWVDGKDSLSTNGVCSESLANNESLANPNDLPTTNLSLGTLSLN